MLASGRGEILTPLPGLPVCYLVLAKPKISVSTAWVYQHYHSKGVQQRPDTKAMLSLLGKKDLQGVAGEICNVLESVTIPCYPEIALLKRQMREFGAIASMMSGSGPTVFGMMPDKKAAESAAEKIKSENKDTVEVFVAKTIQGVK